MRKIIRVLAIVSTFALVFGWGFAQSSQHEAHHGNQEGQGQMMESTQQTVMPEMKGMDQELQDLVEKMKATAPGEQKIEIMETLLAKMVETRIQMDEQIMGKMMPQKMTNMPGHMQMMQQSTEGSMMNFPMMSGYSQQSEGSSTESQEHQH